MKTRLICFTLALGWGALVGLPSAAQPPQGNSNATHPLTLSETLALKSLRGTALSNDGNWLAYQVGPNKGDGEVVVRALQGGKEQRFPAGEGFAGAAHGPNPLVFSEDSGWLAFMVRPTHKQAEALKKQQKSIHNRMQLLNLSTGVATQFDDVVDFAFSGKDSRWLAIYHDQSEALAKDKSKDKPAGADLVLRELNTGAELNIGNVSSFAFDKAGTWLALTIDAQGRIGNGLVLRNMATGVVSAIDSSSAVYERLRWTESGDAVIVLKGWEKKDLENKLYAVVGVTGFASGSLQKVVYDPNKDETFPKNMAISGNRSPRWTDSLDAFLFGICENEKKSGPPAADADAADQEKPNLMIWNWQDTRLPSEQQVQEKRDRQFSFLSIYRQREHKFIRLADDALREVQEPEAGNWTVGFDARAYALTADLEGKSFQDVYSVNLTTGARRLLVSKVRWVSSRSPDGSRFLYYEDGDYHVCVLASGDCTNITAHVPSSFIDVMDDHNLVKPPIPAHGWTSDSKAVLLSDRYDIWQVPVGRGIPVNLTVNGRKDGILYNRYGGLLPLDPEFLGQVSGFDLSQPLYVGMQEEWTKKDGVGRIDPGHPGVHRLLFDDADFAGLFKAKNAPVFIYTRQTNRTPSELYVSGPELSAGKKLTDFTAQLHDIAWSSGAVLVNFASTKGDKLQAALYLPANYEKGRAYPTIVHIYERRTTGFNLFHIYPLPSDPFNMALYTSHGYAVLEPDIKYRVNDPGMSAVWCVLPALKAAIATGIVDASRVGLEGHSWGGYQTAFLVTQTDAFAAASAASPLTDMVSMWSILYAGGGTNGAGFEGGGQGRFSGPPFDNMEAYVRNSPVYQARNVKTPLLMLSNDMDALVNFTQGMEYFNTLRRMGKKVVLLEYPGDGHALAKAPNKRDFEIRMKAFFDHFLKGAPAPEWWSKGISLIRLKAEIKDGTVEKTAAGIEPESVTGAPPSSH